MLNVNFKIIIIVLSIICVGMVVFFGIWVMLSPARSTQKEVKGVSISEQELIQQLEKNVFGDEIK